MEISKSTQQSISNQLNRAATQLAQINKQIKLVSFNSVEMSKAT